MKQSTTSVMDRIIHWSIHNRLVVVIASLCILAYGIWTTQRMPVDVFPDLTAPTVTIVTEAHGLAPQEVETLVTIPIESVMNGATGVRRVRSQSGIGISIVWVEFEWDVDQYNARQIVTEKLQLVANQLPPHVDPPALAPMTSVMGDILFLGVHADDLDSMLVREIADWQVRPRLLSVRGVAQVIPMGADVKEYQVLVDPRALSRLQIGLDEVVRAVEQSNENSAGGFLVEGSQETIIRGIGRVQSIADIERVVVAVKNGVPIPIGQLATVKVGPKIKRGEGAVNGERAVLIAVRKQPGANTLQLTHRIDGALDDIERSLPPGIKIERGLLRQADFIDVSVRNVSIALRDGAILVAIILALFLWNFRTTLISLTALPLSLVGSMIAMKAIGVSINTMTLGGLTIAIGALVDDAIIDVENVLRRLRENRARPESERLPAAQVIFSASIEIRGAILFATLIVMLVFVPLFFLSGIEGRLLMPLGFAYLVAIFVSLIVAITVTPALSSYLLSGGKTLERRDSPVVLFLKRAYRPVLRATLRHPMLVIALAAASLVAALAATPQLGRAFLPEFHEGALTINAVTAPGTSLAEADRIGRDIEKTLLAYPEVESTARRTGRAELDEHAQDVSASEIEVRLGSDGRARDVLLSSMRADLARIPGVVVTIGQPISHRIDHMLSGTRSAVVVKVFGDDLVELRRYAESIKAIMANVEGVVDLSIEQQVDVPQLTVRFDHARIGRYGLTPGALADIMETAYAGAEVGVILEGQRRFDLMVRFTDEQRADVQAIRNTLIDVPVGGKVPLRMLADIRSDMGPNAISRENTRRKLVVMANASGRDVGSIVDDIRTRVETEIPLPESYYVEYGGQYQSERAARQTLSMLGGLVVIGIFLLLYLAFGSTRRALIVMINLPLALIGGIAATFLGGGVLSIGSLVGFITLFGIATRNGLMLVSHYEHLLHVEGASFDEALERGSMERLSPVLMTALSAGLALVPLVLAGARTGNEIQAPMGVVILGGLLTSTALNMLVIPALYARFGRPARTPNRS